MSDQTTATPDPRTDRERVLDDMAALVEWLRDHPEVPVGHHGADWSYSVMLDRDADGIAEIERIAGLCGVPVTGSFDLPATSNDTHLHAIYRIGAASYEATYIRRAAMADYYALNSYNGSVSGGEAS